MVDQEAVKPIEQHGILRRSKMPKGMLLSALKYATLLAGSMLFLYPLAWLLSTSLKPAAQVFVWPPRWIPHPVMWRNYREVLIALPFLQYFKNTLTIAGLGTFGAVFSASLVAFSFARLRWPGRDLLFMVLIASMVVPGQVTMIPVYILFRRLGWLNTFKPLIVPAFFGGGAFNIFLLRQFFLTIPVEIEDSARIDGATNFVIWRLIFLPLSKPALFTIALFSFIGAWQDFTGPLVYLNDQAKYTLQLWLNNFTSSYGADYPLLMAASAIIMAPIIVLFFAAQNYLMQGITLQGGIKG